MMQGICKILSESIIFYMCDSESWTNGS